MAKFTSAKLILQKLIYFYKCLTHRFNAKFKIQKIPEAAAEKFSRNPFFSKVTGFQL